MTRSKGTFGTEFTTGNVLQIFLVLIAVFLVTGLIISASGGIQELLERLCDNIPQLCGEGETSSEYYMISKQSTEALYKASNVVMTGERKYPDITYTDLSVTGAATPPMEGEETGEFETIEFTTAIDEMTACGSRCEERTPECYCVSCEITKTGDVIWIPNPTTPGGLPKIPVPEKTVKCNVIEQKSGINKSAVFCDLGAGYPELEYDARKGPDVWYTFDSGEWKWKCPDENVIEYNELNMMPGILTVVDPVHTEIGKGLIAIDSSLSDEDKYNSGLDVLRDVVLSESFGKDDYITIHYTDEETEKVTRKDMESHGGLRINYLQDMASLERNKHAKCIVKNFHLPQDITKAEEWIAGNGDPEFLVYWQKFPDGEDESWTSFSTWLSNVFTVVLWGLPVTEFLGAAKNFVVGSAKKALLKIGGKSKGLLGKVVQRVTKNEIQEAGERVALFVFREGANRATMKMGYRVYASDEIANEMLKRIGTEGFQDVEERVLREAVEELGKEAYDSGMTKIAAQFNKLPDTQKAGVLNKYMSTQAKGAREAFAPTWNDYKRIMKIAGVTTGLALLGAFFDSVNAKYEEYPQSILLKSPYKDPEPYILEKERPMVLHKELFTGTLGLTQNYVPFYLASPCHADLWLNKREIVCEHYIHDFLDESTICTTPSTDTLFTKFLSGETERCEYFSTNVDEDDFEVKFLEREVELKEKGIGKTLLFGKETVNGEEMDVIYDPIHDLDYYFNRSTQQIEYMKYTADVCIGDFHLDETTGRLECTITEGEEREIKRIEDIPELSVKCGIQPGDSDPLKIFSIGIDQGKNFVGFEQDEVFVCMIYLMNYYPRIEDRTIVALYGNLTKPDNKLDFFFSVVAVKFGTPTRTGGKETAGLKTPHTFIILKDQNKDNTLDMLGHHVISKEYSSIGSPDYEWVSETSRAFTKDMEAGTNCKTDTVLITVNKDPYSEDEHNFCFTQPSEAITTFIFVGTLVADVVASILTNGVWTIVAHTVIGVAGGLGEVAARNIVLWPG